MLTGCVGVNGGGLAHYVGQEKLVNQASWSTIAFANDWGMAPRQQNTPSFHYVHSDQWRYERGFTAYDTLPTRGRPQTGRPHHRHAGGRGAPRLAALLPAVQPLVAGRCPRGRGASGALNDGEIVRHVVDQLKDGRLGFAVEDPDVPENWPRVWFIWRGNAIGTSAKGHEFFLRHYLGTHSNAIAPEMAAGTTSQVNYRPEAPTGKLDLVVDLNFRMDTSALYSDIVLPAATWYEKDDLNTTDLHSYINPMQAAVAPAWESRSDWDIYKAVAKKVSELAKVHLPEPVRDVVMLPLQHDTPDELAQPEVVDWKLGEVEAIPGRTMPKFRVVTRDYVHLYQQMISLGCEVAEKGVSAHGLTIPVADEYDKLARRQPGPVNGRVMPSLVEARQVAEAILALDPASNGELAYRAFQAEEHKTGVP